VGPARAPGLRCDGQWPACRRSAGWRDRRQATGLVECGPGAARLARFGFRDVGVKPCLTPGGGGGTPECPRRDVAAPVCHKEWMLALPSFDARLEEHIPGLRRYAYALVRDRERADDLV